MCPQIAITNELAKLDQQAQLSIEFMRAVIESGPAYPETSTQQEGSDYARMWFAC